MLESLGYRVVAAGSAEEALDRYGDEGRDIDLVLTDVAMPGASGIALAAELRARTPDVNVVFRSGRTQSAPGGPLIRKPFTAGELDELRRALARPPEAG